MLQKAENNISVIETFLKLLLKSKNEDILKSAFDLYFHNFELNTENYNFLKELIPREKEKLLNNFTEEKFIKLNKNQIKKQLTF